MRAYPKKSAPLLIALEGHRRFNGVSKTARAKSRIEEVGDVFPGMWEAMDGRPQAHMDVLVAFPGKTSSTSDATEITGTGDQTPRPKRN
ncbi:hypothetical protein CLH62_06565 [Marinobacter guineae]|uniref:Uncharacterized protein n=1 Tax=Marinobacter guineae TaxID=432303 RepID=A0A2G1VKV9_9GAMM|nr:hypothetical protein CLH62_06565 [Marinobacter guineae]